MPTDSYVFMYISFNTDRLFKIEWYEHICSWFFRRYVKLSPG